MKIEVEGDNNGRQKRNIEKKHRASKKKTVNKFLYLKRITRILLDNHRIANIYYIIGIMAVIVSIIFFFLKKDSGQISPEKLSKNDTSSTNNVFKISFDKWSGFAPFYLAKEKGFFGDLNVQFVEYETTGLKRMKLDNSEIDAIAETMDMFQICPPSATPSSGKIILALDYSNGGDALIVDKSIKKVDDLKNKKIAIQSDMPSNFMLEYFINKSSIKLTDISLFDVPIKDAATEFQNQLVNGAALHEPYLSECLKFRNGSHILLSSKDMIDSLPIIDVLVIREDLLKNHPENVKKFVKGWFSAIDYYKKYPNESLVIMSRNIGGKKEDLKADLNNINWIDLAGNYSLFIDKNTGISIYNIFDNTADILRNNGHNYYIFSANEKIYKNIIDEISQY